MYELWLVSLFYVRRNMKDNEKCICGGDCGEECKCEKIVAKQGEAVTKPLFDLTILVASGCARAKLMNSQDMQKLIEDNDMGEV